METVGEMGTIANVEQQSRGGMALVNQHDAAIAAALGAPLPADAQPSREYVGPPRILMPTVRTSMAAGEALSLKIILLASHAPKKASLYWRPLGKGEFHEVAAKHVARAVYSAAIPPQSMEVLAVEYYVRATWDDGHDSVWPATAPSLNQTVVVHESIER